MKYNNPINASLGFPDWKNLISPEAKRSREPNTATIWYNPSFIIAPMEILYCSYYSGPSYLGTPYDFILAHMGCPFLGWPQLVIKLTFHKYRQVHFFSKNTGNRISLLETTV